MSLVLQHIYNERMKEAAKPNGTGLSDELFDFVRDIGKLHSVAEILYRIIDLQDYDAVTLIRDHDLPSTLQPIPMDKVPGLASTLEVPVWKLMFDLEQYGIDKACSELNTLRTIVGHCRAIVDISIPKKK